MEELQSLKLSVETKCFFRGIKTFILVTIVVVLLSDLSANHIIIHNATQCTFLPVDNQFIILC